jgi:hypothetical protein
VQKIRIKREQQLQQLKRKKYVMCRLGFSTGKLSRIFIVTLILFIFVNLSFADTSNWQEYRSAHFIIHYHSNISASYIRAFSRKCEQYYHNITDKLNLRRFDFWTWDNRARIFIYDTREDYLHARKRPKWSAASVYVKDKLISTYRFDEQFFDSILAHEIAHIILRELIGLDAEVPLWFEEGIACTNEERAQSNYLAIVKSLLNEEGFIPLSDMEKFTNSQIRSKSYTAFYSISASLIIFLQDNYGKINFQKLCRELKDRNPFYKAMDKVYHIKSTQDLQDKFLTYLFP